MALHSERDRAELACGASCCAPCSERRTDAHTDGDDHYSGSVVADCNMDICVYIAICLLRGSGVNFYCYI